MQSIAILKKSPNLVSHSIYNPPEFKCNAMSACLMIKTTRFAITVAVQPLATLSARISWPACYVTPEQCMNEIPATYGYIRDA
jgi:hypothetical protein